MLGTDLITQPDEGTPSSTPDLAVEERIQDGIDGLDVIDEQWVAEAQGAFEMLHEGRIQEAAAEEEEREEELTREEGRHR